MASALRWSFTLLAVINALWQGRVVVTRKLTTNGLLTNGPRLHSQSVAATEVLALLVVVVVVALCGVRHHQLSMV